MPRHTKSPPSEKPVLVDTAALMRHIDGDRQLLREIIEIFLATAPQMLGGIQEAIAVRDGEKLLAVAHALRGAARNFFAGRVEEAALAVEAMGRSGDFFDAAGEYKTLAAELDAVCIFLKRMLRGEIA